MVHSETHRNTCPGPLAVPVAWDGTTEKVVRCVNCNEQVVMPPNVYKPQVAG